MVKIFIDADDTVAGRLASYAAKQAINGDEVIIINAEKAIVSGNREYLLERYYQRITRGMPNTGPFYPRNCKRLLKRIIRGMLPYKEERGRMALKRIKVFEGTPEQFQNNQFETVTKTKHDFKHKKYITLKTLTELMGKQK